MPITNVETESNNNLESTNLLILLFKWRKPILIVCAIAAIASAAVSLIMKEKYKSTVVMFATQQHSFGEQLLEDVKKEDILSYGEEEDAERLLQLINSDQVRTKIIEKHNLWEVYDIKRTDRGANTLIAREYGDNVSARQTKFGSVEVSVLDENPERARDMANDIAAFADSVSNTMRSERAMEAFHYAETSLNDLEAQVSVMEDSMRVLQEMGVYSYVDQIAALTEQYGTAIATGHPDRATLIKDQMDFLSKYGTTYNKIEQNIQEAYSKLGVLRKRYDLMKIDVTTSLPTKFVVDSASSADKKSYPIRWLIVAMSTLSAFVFTVIFLLIWDNFKRLRMEGRI
jgi:capsular polysaccharide biosynthesis protein